MLTYGGLQMVKMHMSQKETLYVTPYVHHVDLHIVLCMSRASKLLADFIYLETVFRIACQKVKNLTRNINQNLRNRLSCH